MHSNINEIFDSFFNNTISKIILSRPKKDTTTEYKKITITARNDQYFIEQFTQKQAFHQTLTFEQTKEYCLTQLNSNFNQLNAFDNSNEYSILVSKKGKISYLKKAVTTTTVTTNTHNRQKNYHLKEGECIPPLIDMGIFTKEGKVVKSMYDKYKQINRFIELVDDVIPDGTTDWTVIDFGCGKSYLTFILYYYLQEVKGIKATIVGLDLKKEVIEKCNRASKKYGYTGLKFELGDINGYTAPFDVNMVVSLHACDTATDYALYNAVKWSADVILSVPCCQHEVNSQFTPNILPILAEYGIVQERVSALLTDSIRGNLLTVSGYKTQVMEFVELSHTPKNLLIRAVKSRIPDNRKNDALKQVDEAMQSFNLKPTLYKLLIEQQ